MDHFLFVNKEEKLVFSSATGRLLSFVSGGMELVTPSEQAFVLRFLLENGEYMQLSETDFASVNQEDESIFWSNCTQFPSLTLELKIKKGNPHEGFRFAAKVSGIPEKLKLDYCEIPRVTVPYDDELMIPYSEGYIASSFVKKDHTNKHLEFNGRNCMLYPGIVQMQFLFAYNSKAGLYFAADDYTHTLKVFDFHADVPEKKIGLRIEVTAGDSYGKAEFKSPCDLVLRRTDPDWRAACEIYREWVKKDPMMTCTKPHPKWLDEPLTVITYPVCGDGNITSKPNRLLPYENALPYIEKLAKGFGTRVMVLLMRWDHNGPWIPPFYWPPVGGAESFRKFRDTLHQQGHLFAVYGSGTCYTTKSKVSDYTGDAYYKEHHLEDSMVQDPNGGQSVKCCSWIRDNEAFCLTEEKGRKLMIDEALILAEEKVDYFQFLDQNLGGKSFPCYAKNHHHPPMPGRWQFESMRNFLDEMNKAIASHGSEMLLGAECAAAGPLLTALPFNDLRDNFNYCFGTHVPAYGYVFHAYANNFHGNQCSADQYFDGEKMPDNLLYRLAYGFCNGAVPTVTLRDSGEIDWGAASDWSKPAPDQDSAIALVHEINVMRRRYPEFLIHGEMTVPRHKLECGSYSMDFIPDYCESREEPSIMQSAWRSADGKYAEFYVNFLRKEQQFAIDGKAYTLAPISILAITE